MASRLIEKIYTEETEEPDYLKEHLNNNLQYQQSSKSSAQAASKAGASKTSPTTSNSCLVMTKTSPIVAAELNADDEDEEFLLIHETTKTTTSSTKVKTSAGIEARKMTDDIEVNVVKTPLDSPTKHQIIKQVHDSMDNLRNELLNKGMHKYAEDVDTMNKNLELTRKKQEEMERLKREQELIRVEKERIEQEKEKLKQEAEQLRAERELILMASGSKHSPQSNLASSTNQLCSSSSTSSSVSTSSNHNDQNEFMNSFSKDAHGHHGNGYAGEANISPKSPLGSPHRKFQIPVVHHSQMNQQIVHQPHQNHWLIEEAERQRLAKEMNQQRVSPLHLAGHLRRSVPNLLTESAHTNLQNTQGSYIGLAPLPLSASSQQQPTANRFMYPNHQAPMSVGTSAMTHTSNLYHPSVAHVASRPPISHPVKATMTTGQTQSLHRPFGQVKSASNILSGKPPLRPTYENMTNNFPTSHHVIHSNGFGHSLNHAAGSQFGQQQRVMSTSQNDLKSALKYQKPAPIIQNGNYAHLPLGQQHSHSSSHLVNNHHQQPVPFNNHHSSLAIGYHGNEGNNITQNVKTPTTISLNQKCTGCAQILGQGSAMFIEKLGLAFHLKCFRCSVCNVPLGNGKEGTDVRVSGTNRLHCNNCFSNDLGNKTFSLNSNTSSSLLRSEGMATSTSSTNITNPSNSSAAFTGSTGSTGLGGYFKTSTNSNMNKKSNNYVNLNSDYINLNHLNESNFIDDFDDLYASTASSGSGAKNSNSSSTLFMKQPMGSSMSNGCNSLSYTHSSSAYNKSLDYLVLPNYLTSTSSSSTTFPKPKLNDFKSQHF